MRLLRLLCFFSLLLPLLGRGALVWETRQVILPVRAGDKEAVGLFPFKNTGKAAVTITDIRASCECTAAELAQRTYAPGEAGAIRVVFTVGERTGPQDRIITVSTDDAAEPAIQLRLLVDIPNLLSYSAKMVYWPVGGQAGEKSIDVSAAGDARIAVLELKEIVPAQATVRIETVEAGTKYRVFFRPGRVDLPWMATATFNVRLEDGGQHSFILYALAK